jgi:hypothetical protein
MAGGEYRRFDNFFFFFGSTGPWEFTCNVFLMPARSRSRKEAGRGRREEVAKAQLTADGRTEAQNRGGSSTARREAVHATGCVTVSFKYCAK